MAVSNVQVNSAVGVDGNSYTTAISNDKLTNEDFLNLMLTELKYQDPTKPMDSQQMMDSQLQMSTIEANTSMITAMTKLTDSFSNLALSNASNMMGKKIDAIADVPMTDEGGNTITDGNGNALTEKIRSSYLVDTIEMLDGDVVINSYELQGFKDNIYDADSASSLLYDSTNGRIRNTDGTYSDYYVAIDSEGRVELDSNYELIINDASGVRQYPKNEDTGNSRFVYTGATPVYANYTTAIKYEDVVKLYNN